jgi:hypothetical protein
MSTFDNVSIARRTFLRAAMGGAAALGIAPRFTPARADEKPEQAIHGLVVIPDNLTLPDWPRRAKKAGLNAISLHHWESAQALCDFVATDTGQKFLEQCREVEIGVEFDFHTMRDLVPRELFAKEPALFRMDEKGHRTEKLNFCVHSKRALELAAENAVAFADKLPTTTGCYYYWADACGDWCRCPKCRELSDSDQLLVVENAIVRALRRDRPQARVAHLACHNSMPAPQNVKPGKGVFLQFAPGRRRYDIPYSQQTRENEIDSLWFLDRNLELFEAQSAQVLEYWLDVTHFPPGTGPLPWNRERFLADVATYRSRGLRQFKSFANGLDAQYVQRHGEFDYVQQYARAL